MQVNFPIEPYYVRWLRGGIWKVIAEEPIGVLKLRWVSGYRPSVGIFQSADATSVIPLNEMETIALFASGDERLL